MKYRNTITLRELKRYRDLLPYLGNDTLYNFVTKLLERASGFIGLPIYFGLSPEFFKFDNKPSVQRALRIISKLKKIDVIENFGVELAWYGDEPPGRITYCSLKGMKRLGSMGRGSDPKDDDKTLWPAVGEAIERFSNQHFKPERQKFIRSSYRDLSGRKLDILNLAGLSQEKRKTLNHPVYNLQYDEDTPFGWLECSTLEDRKKIWAPAQLFSFDYVQNNLNKNLKSNGRSIEPLLVASITTGAATGQNLDDAILRGLLEVFERDAFVIYWLNQLPAKRIDFKSFTDKRFEELANTVRRYNLETHALYLQTDMPVHIVCSVTIDRTGVGPAVAVGAQCGLDFEETVHKAFCESLVQRNPLRRMMENNVDNLDASGDIFNMNHKERMLYWFQEKTIPMIENFISGPLTHKDKFPQYKTYTSNREAIKHLSGLLQKKGYESCFKDITLPKLRHSIEGLTVAIVRVPKMQPLYLEESLMQTEGERLREIPKLLGYKSAENFCTIPHPFP